MEVSPFNNVGMVDQSAWRSKTILGETVLRCTQYGTSGLKQHKYIQNHTNTIKINQVQWYTAINSAITDKIYS